VHRAPVEILVDDHDDELFGGERPDVVAAIKA
jgi:hypothetical protein